LGKIGNEVRKREDRRRMWKDKSLEQDMKGNETGP
jgi:hypothetical protein